MKRLFILVVLVCATIGSASAQKKEILTLTEELNALKAREVELQNTVNELTAAAESNKVLAEQLQTMVAAYENLENAYKSNSEQVVALTAKIDELVSATAAAIAAKEENEASATEPTTPAPAEESKPKYEIRGDIKDGLALVKDGLVYGYVNAKGEMVIAAQFEEATDFAEGMAAVKINNKWGYINTSGKFVISAQYQEACPFGENEYNGLARVKTNNKWGIINKSGQFVVTAQYEIIRTTNDSNSGRWFGVTIHKSNFNWYGMPILDVIFRDGSKTQLEPNKISQYLLQ